MKLMRLMSLLMLIAVAATGCASKKKPVADPTAEWRVMQTRPMPTVDNTPRIADCFDPWFLQGKAVEKFANDSFDVVHGQIQDENRQTVCEFYLEPGRTELGPALWQHQGVLNRQNYQRPTAWRISGDSIVSVTDDTKHIGYAERMPVFMDYQPGFGWHFSYTKPAIRKVR